MNAEQLHDAISLLSADLVAEADKQRRAPRPVLRWKRYAAIAASFVLVLCGSLWCIRFLGAGSAKEAAYEESAVMQGEAPAADAVPCEEAAAEDVPAMQAAPDEPMEDAAPRAETAASGTATAGSGCYAASDHAVILRVEGQEYPLTGEDKTNLAKLLDGLEFRQEDVCECIAEITVIADGSEQYHINLEEGFVRCARGQARLTRSQIKAIREILANVMQ